MIQTIIRYITIGIVCAAIYFLLSHHIIFFDKKPQFLKKSKLTFEYTFVNGKPDKYRTAEDILRIEPLRRDGLGFLMVKMGVITEEELLAIEERINSGAPPPDSGLIDHEKKPKKQ